MHRRSTPWWRNGVDSKPSLCVTSRISTVPRHCKRPMIPTLSIESASDIFHSIYDNEDRSDIIRNLLRRLDFHALSITLLATTASYNMWDQDRLVQEWNTHRVRVLRTDYNGDLAATIELSLASPMFSWRQCFFTPRRQREEHRLVVPHHF